MTTPINDHFYIELLKLLLHVAWADDEISPQEIRTLVHAARRWKVPLEELERLELVVEQGAPMPAPNLGLLREHPDEVLATVHNLIHSDEQVHLAEEETLAQIRELLGLGPA